MRKKVAKKPQPVKKPTAFQVIIRHAHQFGLDPAAVIAYALEESGGRWDALGDQGTSFGPFQMHRGGALGNHPGAWAESPAGIIAGMRMMSETPIRGLKGPEAVRAIYKYFGKGTPAAIPRGLARLSEGQKIAGSPLPPEVPGSPQSGSQSLPGASMQAEVIPQVITAPEVGDLPGGFTGKPVKTLPGLPDMGQINIVSPIAPHVPNPPAVRKKVHQGVTKEIGGELPGGGTLFGAGVKPKVIGLPYQGTHGKAFNVKGGSDNWESENAVDFSVPIGTPVYATEDGVIGNQIGSLGSGGRFAGLRLHLITKGNEWYYAHLSKLSVHAGQHVRKGQLLGYTGEANGVPHLHIATREGHPPE